MKEKLKNENKAITLIALIITIIVMLILVGVTLNLALNGGLLTTAKNATEQTKKEQDRERLQVAVWGAYDEQGELDASKLKENLPNGFTEEDGTYRSENGNNFVVENGKVIDAQATENEGGDESGETGGEESGETGGEDENNPISITLDQDLILLKVDGETTIVATVTNSEEEVQWESSDPEVVSIEQIDNNSALVTSKVPGLARVYAQCGGKSRSCRVVSGYYACAYTRGSRSDCPSILKTGGKLTGATFIGVYFHTDVNSDIDAVLFAYKFEKRALAMKYGYYKGVGWAYYCNYTPVRCRRLSGL